MIALIDYGGGNTASVANALNDLSTKYRITNDPTLAKKCDKIIFPGVGEASSAMEKVKSTGLDSLLKSNQKPLLGICLGMQLLGDFSEERETDCIGVVPFTVKAFNSDEVKVPHMGWNKVKKTASSPLFRGIEDGEYFYFANSYYVPICESTSATAEHGIRFTASVVRRNFYGVQFHPEKSGPAGIKLLKNFLEI